MVRSYFSQAHAIEEIKGFKEHALWYDLLNLKEHEKIAIAKQLNLFIPSQKEMGKIGTSNCFYSIDHTLYMTASIVTQLDFEKTILLPITFILHPQYLVTLRYAEPKSFQIFKQQLLADKTVKHQPISLFLALLDTIINRGEERAEKMSLEIDALLEEIFNIRAKRARSSRKLSDLLTRLGKKGNVTTKINESLMSFERLLSFMHFHIADLQGKKHEIERVKILQQDVHSIAEHVNFLSHKINFLLDATLGYISIEQNGITKVFTVVAVIFLPPTLVSSIYGMNFKRFPELNWAFGYPFALVLMLILVISSFIYFKRKGWL